MPASIAWGSFNPERAALTAASIPAEGRAAATIEDVARERLTLCRRQRVAHAARGTARRTAGFQEHGRRITEALDAARGRSRQAGEERRQLTVQLARRPDPGTGDHAAQPPGGGVGQQLAGRPELIRPPRNPALPRGQHVRGVREVERQEVDLHGRGRADGHGQRRHRPEAPAPATTQRPEQVGIVVRVDGPGPAVGGDDSDRSDRITREAAGTAQHPQSTAQGQTGDAHRRAGTAGQRYTFRAQS